MKKIIVLVSLFILPIVAYIFFASGINNFVRLPVVTPNLKDISQWSSLGGERVTLDNKITILGFMGADLLNNRGNAFNLNQKIYKRYYQFNDFQLVMVVPLGTEDQARELLTKLEKFTDVTRWFFVFTTPEEIQVYYDNLKLVAKLDDKKATPNVFIVDKERNLRGRKGEKEYNEGYNTISPADLNNIMMDDVKIILAEYRLALKQHKQYTSKKSS